MLLLHDCPQDFVLACLEGGRSVEKSAELGRDVDSLELSPSALLELFKLFQVEREAGPLLALDWGYMQPTGWG
ncbi:hypothetical protein V3481_012605 [Fusarium oxysporum f. sp. vasinfectum]